MKLFKPKNQLPVPVVLPAPVPVPEPSPASQTEPDRLTVKLFPTFEISAVGHKPISMVPWLLVVMSVIIVLFGPMIRAGVEHGSEMVVGIYEHVTAPDEKPPD